MKFHLLFSFCGSIALGLTVGTLIWGSGITEFRLSDWFVLALAVLFVASSTFSAIVNRGTKKEASGAGTPETKVAFVVNDELLRHPYDIVFAKRFFAVFGQHHKYYKYSLARQHVQETFQSLSFCDESTLDDRQQYMIRELNTIVSGIFGIIEDIDQQIENLPDEMEELPAAIHEELDQMVAMVAYYDTLRFRCIDLGCCSI